MATVRVDYGGRINLRGARDNVRQKQNQPFRAHTGKNLRTPKRHIVSGRPAGYGESPTYAPGSFTRGMGYSDNGGYFATDEPREIAPEFDLTTLDGLRAARDHALTRAREAKARGNLVVAEYAQSDAREFRKSIRAMEKRQS
ncbi:hypothetical protein [Streptomyces sp. WAC 06738]|uniref:hypothetical protein n=1 Tax=Streptomyces sp. WAC 06738 TaxID=2203210 RepID=UPI000F76E23E|nr:hypothetical protein [Streptomyces sp. WAC 06738]